MERAGKKSLQITLTAPLNFFPEKQESVEVVVGNYSGDTLVVTLAERGAFSESMTSQLYITKKGLRSGDQTLSVKSGETVTVSY